MKQWSTKGSGLLKGFCETHKISINNLFGNNPNGWYNCDGENLTWNEYDSQPLYQELTIDELNKLYEKNTSEVDEFVLPEKWCVKRTSETASTLNEYFRNLKPQYQYEFNPSHGNFDYIHSEPITSDYSHPHVYSYNGEESKKEGFTEITFEQFKKYVINKKTEVELIGYKAPINLYGGEVKKSDIYVVAFNKNYYQPLGKNDENIVLPKEIVETWEPVYKEDKDFKVGDIIVITECPQNWNSRFSENNIRHKVKYPFIARIDKMDDEAMSAGGGGWALNRLIKSKTIRKATEFEINLLKEDVRIKLSNDKVVKLQYDNDSFKIIAEGQEIKYDMLERLVFDSNEKVNDWTVKLISGTYTIGCWTVTLNDIKLIIDTYKAKSNYFNETV